MGEELGPEVWKPHSRLPMSWPPAPPSSPSSDPPLPEAGPSAHICSRLLSYWVPSARLAAPSSSCLTDAQHAASPLGCGV